MVALAGIASAHRPWRLAGAAVAAIAVLVPLAWLASNVVDDAEEPLPAVLAVPADSAAIDNAAYRHLAAMATGPGLSQLAGPPIVCPAQDDCPTFWRQNGEALAAQLAPHAELGERCLALEKLRRFEEPAVVPPLQGPIAPHGAPAARCSTWFTAQAVLAALQDREAEAIALLRSSDRLTRQLLSGSQTLVGNAVAWRLARRHFQAIQAVAAVRPRWIEQLMPLAQPLPQGALDPRRWMRLEAGYARRAMEELLTVACADNNHWLTKLSCRSGIGWLPRATTQELDRLWARRLMHANDDPLHTLQAISAVETRPPPAWRWRNTFAGALLQHEVPEGWQSYLARAADVHLHAAVVALGLQAATVPPAKRRDWLSAQTTGAAALRERLRWSDDALTLSAEPWGPTGPGALASRRIEFLVPAPT